MIAPHHNMIFYIQRGPGKREMSQSDKKRGLGEIEGRHL